MPNPPRVSKSEEKSPPELDQLYWATDLLQSATAVARRVIEIGHEEVGRRSPANAAPAVTVELRFQENPAPPVQVFRSVNLPLYSWDEMVEASGLAQGLASWVHRALDYLTADPARLADARASGLFDLSMPLRRDQRHEANVLGELRRFIRSCNQDVWKSGYHDLMTVNTPSRAIELGSHRDGARFIAVVRSADGDRQRVTT